jgi:putative transposase
VPTKEKDKMEINPNEIYHIYNQGNNKEAIFINSIDYIQFLKLFRKFVAPNCKVFAYCLMPNHFHFLIYATQEAATIKQSGNVETTLLANGFRLLQSRYAQEFNLKYNRVGSLFRQKAKAKSLREGTSNYLFIAFQYIHQNPLKANLVNKLEDWQYSSFFGLLQFKKRYTMR